MERNKEKNSDKPVSILFVYLGNICRSPAAEGVMKRLVEREGRAGEFLIDSAGLIGYHRGELPDPRMRNHAARRGLQLTHRSRPVTTDDFLQFDLILGMDDRNLEELHHLAPSLEAEAKIHRMTDFCRHHPGADHVPDPYYGGSQGFDLVLDLLEDACQGLLEYLINLK